MLLNADFRQAAQFTPDQYQWMPSSSVGIDRMMLDRVGEEVARATSVVRYAKDAKFPFHRHPGGEEILVLSGELKEGEAVYPQGWYLRNPPGSSHETSSLGGATLFVKLWQMSKMEHQPVRINTRDPNNWKTLGARSICLLFNDGQEIVSLQKLPPDVTIPALPAQGMELFVLEGSLLGAMDIMLSTGSWLRIPQRHSFVLRTGNAGATIYLKIGHLATLATPSR